MISICLLVAVLAIATGENSPPEGAIGHDNELGEASNTGLDSIGTLVLPMQDDAAEISGKDFLGIVQVNDEKCACTLMDVAAFVYHKTFKDNYGYHDYLAYNINPGSLLSLRYPTLYVEYERRPECFTRACVQLLYDHVRSD